MNAISQIVTIAVTGFGLLLVTNFLGWNLAYFARRAFTFQNPFPRQHRGVGDAVSGWGASVPDLSGFDATVPELGGWPDGQMTWYDE